jgi:hypothetical protein
MPKKAPRAPRSGSRGGAPRKVDPRTGSRAGFARAIAAALPGVTVTNRSGRASFAVDKHRFLVVNDGNAQVMFDAGEAITLQFGVVGRDELRATIEEAWESFAPKPAITTYRRRKAARAKQRAITPDDIRRVVAALPDANEGPIWGKDLGFRVGPEKKTRFARFGPPESGRVGNLLPPDDAGTLVIFHCEAKPELLASTPERYFTTPHYGDDDGPGGIIVRLSEFRGDAELEELAELLEDAWREVATPEQIAAFEAYRAR